MNISWGDVVNKQAKSSAREGNSNMLHKSPPHTYKPTEFDYFPATYRIYIFPLIFSTRSRRIHVFLLFLLPEKRCSFRIISVHKPLSRSNEIEVEGI